MSTPLSRSIPAAEVQKKFGFYQDEAIRGPVLISKNGRPKTVLLSYEEFLRLSERHRKAYAVDDLPPDLASTILSATVPDDLEDEILGDRSAG